MTTPQIQQIIERGLPYLNTERLSPRQWQVLRHIQGCRTEVMGSYRWRCDHCHREVLWHCSCRDRHCPVCQGQASRKWLAQRQRDVLPVVYHHLVFTLPHEFNEWADRCPKMLYGALFHSAWESLQAFATARHHLAGQLGMIAVLHTWGQSLCRHIHLHCLVPGGVLTAARQWQGTRKPGYLLPVKALSVKFKGRMCAMLAQLSQDDELSVLSPTEVANCLDRVKRKTWVVYSKAAINRTEGVLGYLARYCKRIGLSERRLSLEDDGQVRLAYKDNRTGNRSIMSCSPQELLRRFLLHVLPKGFMRIRYYGYLANAVRRRAIATIRDALAVETSLAGSAMESQPAPRCPYCRQASLRLIELTLPGLVKQNLRTSH